MKITYWSDYACPYCYIGETRLKKAIAQIPELEDVEIEMKAFQLDPSAGEHATGDTQTRFAHKYGLSFEEAGRRIEGISRLGQREGLDFRYAQTLFTNTMDAHRLTKLAQSKVKPELSEKLIEGLFKAYFTENKELADHQLLQKIGEDCGLDREEVKSLLESDQYREEVIEDEQTNHGFLIDPGAQAENLLELIREQEWIIEKILLTHGHFDHTGAVNEIRRQLQIPVIAYRTADEYLLDPVKNLSSLCGPAITVRNVIHVEDGDCIILQANPDCSLKVIHTPGHTPDSVLYYSERDHLAFAGDTIFKGSPGTDQFPGGNSRQLLRSICEKIMALPDETVLFTGHSEQTMVVSERIKYQRYMR